MAEIIEVEHLVAHYGTRLILDDLSFAVQQGEILVVLGGSGSGKSTLLKHMVGLLRPTAGTVRYWGRDLVQMDEEERARLLKRVGSAFQAGGLFNSLTLTENVALPLWERGGLDEETIQALVRMKLSLVGLADAGHQVPGELSGGMKKRAGVARALALDPEILFFVVPAHDIRPQVLLLSGEVTRFDELHEPAGRRAQCELRLVLRRARDEQLVWAGPVSATVALDQETPGGLAAAMTRAVEEVTVKLLQQWQQAGLKL
jgi:ABC-type polar amino acid transport system ATPase subunit